MARRKTAEEREAIQAKIPEIIDLINKYEVSYYEIGENTLITSSGIKKIVDKITKNPSLENLLSVERYIINKYIDKTMVEPSSSSLYGLDKSLSRKLDLIIENQKKLETQLSSHDLKQEIMFEILQSAKAEELDFIKKESQKRLKSIKR